MHSMTSRLQIINSALSDVGGRPLQSDPIDVVGVSGGTSTQLNRLGNTVALLYPQVREASLAEHPWSWLMETASLVGIPNPRRPESAPQGEPLPAANEWPGEPYRFRWRHPSPTLGAVRAMFDRLNSDTPRVGDWKVEGRTVFTTFTPAVARFPREVSEPVWPQLFVNAVILRLAERLAVPVAFDMELQSRFRVMADAAFTSAKKVDTQSQPNEQITSFGFVDAHLGGTGSGYSHSPDEGLGTRV